MNISKYYFILRSLAIVCLIGLSGSVSAQALNSIVAIVNDSVITQTQLNQAIQMAKQQLTAQQAALPAASVLRERVLQHLIDAQLQWQLAKANHLIATDAQVDQAIAGIAKDHQLTVPQLRAALIKQGIPYPKYREDIRQEVTIAQLEQKELGSKIVLSDSAVAARAKTLKLTTPKLSMYHVYAIVVPLPKQATPADIERAMQQGQTIAQKWRTETDPLRVVQSVAALPGQFPMQNGDLGWHAVDEFPPVFSTRLKALHTGDLLGPIRTPNGVIHVMKLLGLRADSQQSPSSTQTHVRHILIKTDTLTNATAAKLRLLQLKNQLDHGAVFADLAQVNSQDPGSAAHGGDLGWTEPGSLVPEFQAVIDKLGVNQISQPFMTSYGWHIAQVLGRRQIDASKHRTLEAARQQLYQEKFSIALKTWLAELRKQAYIQVMNGRSSPAPDGIN